MIRNKRGPGIQFKNRLFSITEYRLIVSVHPDSEERHVHLISVRILEPTSRMDHLSVQQKWLFCTMQQHSGNSSKCILEPAIIIFVPFGIKLIYVLGLLPNLQH